MDTEELKQRADQGADIVAMTETPGWKLLEAHMREQIRLLTYDCALHSESWENYLQKREQIRALELLLINVEDFKRQGEEAEKEIG